MLPVSFFAIWIAKCFSGNDPIGDRFAGFNDPAQADQSLFADIRDRIENFRPR